MLLNISTFLADQSERGVTMESLPPHGKPAERELTAAELAKIDHLLPEHLEATAVRLAAEISADEDVITYGISTEALGFFLGYEWTVANVFGQYTGASSEYRSGREFLKSETFRDSNSRLRHAVRVTRLAECLFNLQLVPGIKHRVAMLKIDNLETALGEMECAALFTHPDLKLRFIVPGGTKGQDYEAEIVTPAGTVVCCEIKTKKETTNLSHNTIRSTLDKARKQLPKSKPGLVVLKIPEPWTAQRRSRAIVLAAVAQVLRQSNRLVAIVLAWEDWFFVGGGCRVAYKFEPFFNKQIALYSEEIEKALGMAGGLRNPDHVSFRTIANRALLRSKAATNKASVGGAEAPDQPPAAQSPPDHHS